MENKMTNVFKDQEKFMTACDQSVNSYNEQQLALYFNLIDEEHSELKQAVNDNDRVEILDALLDIIVVSIGALHSMGCQPEDAWNEVMKTNFAKICSTTGKVIRRESDNKILKPEGWTPPDIKSILKK